MRFFKYVRLVLRAIVAFLWTLAVHYFLIRIPQLFKRKRYLGALSIWGSGLARIMGIRVHKRNERSGPMGDVIVANHMGFLDVPVLLRFFPAVFIIKMEMRRVLYFGGCLEHQGHVFVERKDKRSRKQAGEELLGVLGDDDRIIVFPEGRASPGAERLPFRKGSFAAVAELDKTVELCVLDYLPDRRMLEWDVDKPMRPQLVDLFGMRRIDISVEFFPAEKVDDPAEVANRYKNLVEERLEVYDTEREVR
jgi:1-acyl-sn-glycerol-3-phosphate acyltransferase